MSNGCYTDARTSEAIALHTDGYSRLIRSLEYGAEYIVAVDGIDYLITELDFGKILAERLDTIRQNA